ncbi:MAG: hypothetical protein IT385_23060 [Deltaproteobacteria bacterium]|nr:hypothetical protein [Deltaproteobacteria bacterium]
MRAWSWVSGIVVMGVMVALGGVSGARRPGEVGLPASLAGDWSRTFAGPGLTAQAMPGEVTVALVAAGPPSDALTAARTALARAMVGAGRWQVIDGDAKAGGDLDDASIVARLRGVKADVVWILRVYPGAPGRPSDAVVSVFAPDGTLRRAFAASEGAELPVASGGSGGGVSSGTLQAVRSVDGERATPVSEAEAAYLKERVHERQTAAMIVTQHGAAYVAAGPKLLFEGDRMIEDGPDFYRTVGRVDLAEQYESTASTKGTLNAIGWPTFFVGGLLPLAGIGGYDDGYDWTIGGIGIGIASVGLVMTLVAASMDPDPLTPSGKRQLIESHNGTLRNKYGLTAEPVADERPSGPRARVGVTAGPDGGALQLHVGF